MPNLVIIICSIIALVLLLWNYIQRFVGLHRRTYQIHPLTPVVWIMNSILAIIFLAVSRNFVLAGLGAVAMICQIVFLVWGIHNLRRDGRKNWRIEKGDVIAFAMAIAAAVLFYTTKNANLGAMIIFVGGILGEIPQLRKAFTAPNTDEVRFYVVPAVRYTILTGTLTDVNFVGLTNSLFWALFCVAEAGWILWCKKRGRKSREIRRTINQ